MKPTSAPSSNTSAVDSFTIAVQCPGCGSGIDFVEGTTTVACAHCGMSHIILGTGGIKRFYIPKRIPRWKVVESVEMLVIKSLAEEGRRTAVRMIDAKLVYVPFFRVKLRGGGWYIAHESKTAPKSIGVDENGQPIYVHPTKRKVNNVFVKEGTYFSPAIDISDLGRFGISTKSSILKLHVLRDEDQKTKGMFFDPVKDPEAAVREAWAMLVGAARPSDVTLDYFEAEKVSEELSQIYHPLWIVRFLLGEHAVRVVVDGVSGEIVRARIPIRRKMNPLPGVLIAGTTAFLIAALKQFFIPLLLAGAFIFFMLPDRSGITRFFYRHIVRPWDDGEVVIG